MQTLSLTLYLGSWTDCHFKKVITNEFITNLKTENRQQYLQISKRNLLMSTPVLKKIENTCKRDIFWRRMREIKTQFSIYVWWIKSRKEITKVCVIMLTKNFLPEKTSIKISGIISSVRKLSISPSINILEYFLLHM